jgi:hypothetical protein
MGEKELKTFGEFEGKNVTTISKAKDKFELKSIVYSKKHGEYL